MSNEIEITAPPGVSNELLKLINRCYIDQPKPEDMRELARWAARQPDLVKAFFDLSAVVQAQLVQKIATQPGQRLSLVTGVKAMRGDMGHDHAPVIEKLLIDAIVNAWLRYQWTELQLSSFMGRESVRFSEVGYWEKRLTLAQGRYLRAIEALAKVRKMQLPALQVNIAHSGGQQVNVAGDVVKRP